MNILDLIFIIIIVVLYPQIKKSLEQLIIDFLIIITFIFIRIPMYVYRKIKIRRQKKNEENEQ